MPVLQPDVARQGSTTAEIANLPNFLTLLRILAVPLLVWLLDNPTKAGTALPFVVYFLATITDILDGYIARKHGTTTALGKLLDPLADKLLVVSALIMLAMMDRTPSIPAPLVVLIIGRELAVTGLRSIAANEGIVLAAETSGKLKMILQSVGIHALILHYTHFGIHFYTLGFWLLAVSTAVGLWSAVQYHVSVFSQMSTRR